MLNKIKEIECFVFDMDGTIYLSEELIDGALEMFNYFNKNDIKYYFLTNNSSKTSKTYLEKLKKLDLGFVKEEQIITSGDVTIEYLKNTFKNPKVYLVGTKDLSEDFVAKGIKVVKGLNEDIDAVVVGFDTTFDYDKASIATRYIRKGIPFIATHLDLVCPIQGGEFIPDCGAIAKMIELSSGVEPKFIGKPCEETVEYLVKKVNLDKSKIAVVGDRLYTDVATGVKNGMTGVAVLTGETTEEEIAKSEIKPTFTFRSIKELLEEIK